MPHTSWNNPHSPRFLLVKMTATFLKMLCSGKFFWEDASANTAILASTRRRPAVNYHYTYTHNGHSLFPTFTFLEKLYSVTLYIEWFLGFVSSKQLYNILILSSHVMYSNIDFKMKQWRKLKVLSSDSIQYSPAETRKMQMTELICFTSK